MSWHWIALFTIIVLGNFLGIGSMLIGFANAPAVIASGADVRFRGTSRYTIGIILAVLLQSIMAVTLSALIISYARFVTENKWSYIFIWIISIIGAIYPMWQTWSLAKMERVSEPESYITKEV